MKVFDFHLKSAKSATAVSGATVIVFLSGVDNLSQAVLDFIFIVGLKRSES